MRSRKESLLMVFKDASPAYYSVWKFFTMLYIEDYPGTFRAWLVYGCNKRIPKMTY